MNIQGTLYDLNDSRFRDVDGDIIVDVDPGKEFVIENGGDLTITDGGSIYIESDEVATQPWVDQQIANLAGALVLRGTVNSASDWSTIFAAAHKKGDTYLVTSGGTYAGEVCEAGDLIVCTAAYSAGGGANNRWTVVQNNLDIKGVAKYKGILDSWSDASGSDPTVGDFWIIDSAMDGETVTLNNGVQSGTYTVTGGSILYCIKDVQIGGPNWEPSDNPDSFVVIGIGDSIGSGAMVYKGQIDGADDITHDGYAGDVYYVTTGSNGYWLNHRDTPAGGALAIAITDYGAYSAQNDDFTGGGTYPGQFELCSFGGNAYTFAGQNSQVAIYDGTDAIRGKTLSAIAGISVAQTSSTVTFSHSNSITAGAFGPSASASGISFALPYVQYDAQGHISSVASFTHTIPTFMPATSSSAGQAGVLPAMSSMTSEQETWVLYANGTWGPQLGSGDEGYTLPLAASGTRGGLQIGYATDRTSGYFAVQLESEKAYVAVPTFTGATSQANGDIGLVPQAMASASQTFLRADGAWADVAYVSSNILYM